MLATINAVWSVRSTLLVATSVSLMFPDGHQVKGIINTSHNEKKIKQIHEKFQKDKSQVTLNHKIQQKVSNEFQ